MKAHPDFKLVTVKGYRGNPPVFSKPLTTKKLESIMKTKSEQEVLQLCERSLPRLLRDASAKRAESFVATNKFLELLREVAAAKSTGLTRSIIERGVVSFGNREGFHNCSSFKDSEGNTICVSRDTADVVS